MTALVLGLMLGADPSAAYLSAARNLYRELDYEAALEQLGSARRVVSERALSRRAELEVWRGLVLLHLGRDAEARTALVTALSLDPSARLPEPVSPRVSAVFDAVKRALAPVAQRRSTRARTSDGRPRS